MKYIYIILDFLLFVPAIQIYFRVVKRRKDITK